MAGLLSILEKGMSAEQDHLAIERLAKAQDAARSREVAVREAHEARLRFIRDARSAGWSWQRIGHGLGLTDRGASRYWSEHRMEAGRLV